MQSVGATSRQRMRVRSGGVFERMSFGQRCASIWFVIWVLTFIIVGAIYYSIWKNDNRAPLIDRYNQMVAEFTAQRNAFSQLSVNISLIRLSPLSPSAHRDLSDADYEKWSAGIGPFTTAAIVPNDSLSDPNAVATSELFPYQPIAYLRADSTQFLPDSKFDHLLQFSFRVNITAPNGKVSLISTATNGYGPFSPFRLVTLSPSEIGCDTGKYCAQSCVAVGGVWTYPTCTIYYMMTSACLRVAQSTSDPSLWQFDDSYGDGDDGGCGFFEGRFSIEHYKPIVYSLDTIYPLSTSLQTWTVRLTTDPWTYAAWLTAGAMNFGPVTDPNAKGAAIACLVLGILPLGVFVLYAAYATYYKRWPTLGGGGGESHAQTLAKLRPSNNAAAASAAIDISPRDEHDGSGGSASPSNDVTNGDATPAPAPVSDAVDDHTQTSPHDDNGSGTGSAPYTQDVVAGLAGSQDAAPATAPAASSN